MQKEVWGDHKPSFLFFAKPAIQDPDIQPGVFLDKMKGQQSVSFLFIVILWAFRLFSLVCSK